MMLRLLCVVRWPTHLCQLRQNSHSHSYTRRLEAARVDRARRAPDSGVLFWERPADQHCQWRGCVGGCVGAQGDHGDPEAGG